MPRRRCAGCDRPLAACLCAFLQPVATRHRVIVLQHPREARTSCGTVRVLRLALPAVIVRVGVDFTRDAELPLWLTDAERPPALLFPGEDVAPLAGGVAGGPRTLIALDGTWSQARSLLARNPAVAALARIALRPRQASCYLLRPQPHPGCLSTLEAVAEALALMDHDPSVRDALLEPLHAMVGLQLACADARGSDVLADRALLGRSGYLPRAR